MATASVSSRSTFARLHAGYAGSLYRKALRLTGHHQDAEDLLQDLWVQVWTHLDTLHSPEAAGAWLFRTLQNLYLDRRRRTQVRPETVPLDVPLVEDSLSLADTLPDPDAGPHQVLLRRLENAALQELVDRLKPDQWTAVVLHDLEGLEYEEFPSTLPLSTWRNRRARGLKTLQQLTARPDSRLDLLRSAA